MYPLGAEIVTVGLEMSGAEVLRPFVEVANPEHPSLVDETHRMDVLFGEGLCPRRGPGAFEEAKIDAQGMGGSITHASVTGLKAVRPTGWMGRYLILGTGLDDCALDGCYHHGDNGRASDCGMCGCDCNAEAQSHIESTAECD